MRLQTLTYGLQKRKPLVWCSLNTNPLCIIHPYYITKLTGSLNIKYDVSYDVTKYNLNQNGLLTKIGVTLNDKY